ncbi:MAG: helix-turn-helix domain-containing protein [Solirubrobacteraceae bacterium]
MTNSAPSPAGAPLARELLRELQHDQQALDDLARLFGAREPGRSAKLLDVAETADLLGLHPDTLARFARRGRIWAKRVGREWRFDPERLEIVPVDGGPPAASRVAPVPRRPARAEFRAVEALRKLG